MSEIFEAFWKRYQWLNRGKNHKESAAIAFSEEVTPLFTRATDDLHATNKHVELIHLRNPHPSLESLIAANRPLVEELRKAAGVCPSAAVQDYVDRSGPYSNPID